MILFFFLFLFSIVVIKRILTLCQLLQISKNYCKQELQQHEQPSSFEKKKKKKKKKRERKTKKKKEKKKQQKKENRKTKMRNKEKKNFLIFLSLALPPFSLFPSLPPSYISFGRVGVREREEKERREGECKKERRKKRREKFFFVMIIWLSRTLSRVKLDDYFYSLFFYFV